MKERLRWSPHNNQSLLDRGRDEGRQVEGSGEGCAPEDVNAHIA